MRTAALHQFRNATDLDGDPFRDSRLRPDLPQSPTAPRRTGRRTQQVQALALLVRLSPRPWDQAVFLERLAAHRGKPVLVTATVMPAEMSGVWMATRHADYIFVTEAASHTRTLMIIAHEIAHILLGHRSAVAPSSPHVSFQTDQERDAEMVATAFTAQLGFSPAGWGTASGAPTCPSI